MDMMRKKIHLINKISDELTVEFPNIILKTNKKVSSNIIFVIYYKSKSSDVNKFYMIDGGRKDRIIRKTKNLLKSKNISYSNRGNIFII